MKNLKTLFLTLLMLAAFSAVSQAQSTDSATVVGVEKFQKMTQKHKNILLDIRTPEEMSEGHLKGATNLDFLDESFSTKIAALDKNKTYLIYCRSGKRTAKAGAAMKAAGFKKVYMLDGGITAWKESGKPIEDE
ncbi:rhodanese-like domain-containing protein [Algoriphagus sp. CAU 1675]|uniref:rhodanese-like domain-containing protein n=1 Tax=Algoriphagus sp. CAU 1675 TaxID=3032597 RepID=UPI0023DCE58E|nr:rhodanese-like domain-containing protein [Algoriphagus sp. CAU 1675]MDF2157467.1 rhodanese-like domain-containing protein [Algoriphagus sp. CAU 1675]